jgi:hypothetical protein
MREMPVELELIKGEVGGSSPPKPTIQNSVVFIPSLLFKLRPSQN